MKLLVFYRPYGAISYYRSCFLRYLSDNHEAAAKKALGRDYPKLPEADPAFEKQMRRKMHYVVQPKYLWNHIAELARMNMLLHGVKDSEFHIHHGDTLLNDWDMLQDMFRLLIVHRI